MPAEKTNNRPVTRIAASMALAAFVAFGLTSCGTARDPGRATAHAYQDTGAATRKSGKIHKAAYKKRSYRTVGWASWYGRRFHGRKTANGERYNMNALTAAHRTLPFGTKVRVTNLGNGRSVVVRINDRGPFIKGRIIDLSRRGANALRFIKKGKARVRLKIMG